ncbi:RNA dependent RNA polymerase-domain-containing protein [Chytriomyces cf. hyalinus JEL632]|nr:RNA dependent RNA polymerase-domain-containing protein [Chytriomyces cf. hyalinus JEL632]
MRKLNVRVYRSSTELVIAGGPEKKILGPRETISALEAASVPISIIGMSKPSLYGALNAQVIGLLLERGVPLEVISSKNAQYRNAVKFAMIDIRAAFDLLHLTGRLQQLTRLHKAMLHQNTRDLHRIWNEIRDIQRFEVSRWTKGSSAIDTDTLREDARLEKLEPLRRVVLPLRESRRLFGVAGVSEELREGCCFVQVTGPSGDVQCITGPVLVVRNPCYHPGDIILLKAVQVQDLSHLVDVVVFSTKGARPPADMSSGGDLDGDTFIVIWDKQIVSPVRNFTPFDYRQSSIQATIHSAAKRLNLPSKRQTNSVLQTRSMGLSQILVKQLTDPVPSTAKIGLIDGLLLTSQKYQADSTKASRFTAEDMRNLLTAMFTVGIDSLDVDVSAMITAIHLEIYNSQTADLSVHYMLLEMIKTTADSAARFIKSIEHEDFCWDFFESSVNEDLFWKQVDLVDSFCPPLRRENISIAAKAIKLLDKIISQQPQETTLISANTLKTLLAYFPQSTVTACSLATLKLEQDVRRAKSGFAGVEDLYHQIAALDSEDFDATTRQMKKVSEYSKQSEAAKSVMDRCNSFNAVIQSVVDILEGVVHLVLESQVIPDLEKLLKVELKILASELPIYSPRAQIAAFTKSDSKTCLILSSTGSGKSTCIPHFMAHELFMAGKLHASKKIIVAQPRRNATTSLAKRLASMLDAKVGAEIGSHIGKSSSLATKGRTIIHCVTYGILLSYANRDPHFKEYSIAMLDEVHEDSPDLHFLMGLLKNAQKFNPGLKVVLMSAQVNSSKFTEYYHPCQVIQVNGRSFPVTEEFVGTHTKQRQTYIASAVEAVMKIHDEKEVGDNPDVLVFLPRVADIQEACSMLERLSGGTDCSPIYAFELHSGIEEEEKQFILNRLPMNQRFSGALEEDESDDEESSSDPLDRLSSLEASETDSEDSDDDSKASDTADEGDSNLVVVGTDATEAVDILQLVFTTSEHPERRVIFCTNVAETSLTFQKVGFVVDAGLQLVVNRSPVLGIQKFILQPTTSVAAVQRKGRAGRLAPGHCVRLYSHQDSVNFQDQTFSGPESLDTMILQVISVMGDLKSFEWFVKPSDADFQFTLRGLRGLRMIRLNTTTKQYELHPDANAALDFSRKGVSVEATRFVLDVWTSGLDVALKKHATVIAALLSGDSTRMFRRNFSYSKIQDWSETIVPDDGSSLPSTFCKLNVYFNWRSLSKRKRKKWCKKYQIDGVVMQEIHDLVKVLTTMEREYFKDEDQQGQFPIFQPRLEVPSASQPAALDESLRQLGISKGQQTPAMPAENDTIQMIMKRMQELNKSVKSAQSIPVKQNKPSSIGTLLVYLAAARFQYIGKVSRDQKSVTFWMGAEAMKGYLSREELIQFPHKGLEYVLINAVSESEGRYFISQVDPIAVKQLATAHQHLHDLFSESFKEEDADLKHWRPYKRPDLFHRCSLAEPLSDFVFVNSLPQAESSDASNPNKYCGIGNFGETFPIDNEELLSSSEESLRELPDELLEDLSDNSDADFLL